MRSKGGGRPRRKICGMRESGVAPVGGSFVELQLGVEEEPLHPL